MIQYILCCLHKSLLYAMTVGSSHAEGTKPMLFLMYVRNKVDIVSLAWEYVSRDPTDVPVYVYTGSYTRGHFI